MSVIFNKSPETYILSKFSEQVLQTRMYIGGVEGVDMYGDVGVRYQLVCMNHTHTWTEARIFNIINRLRNCSEIFIAQRTIFTLAEKNNVRTPEVHFVLVDSVHGPVQRPALRTETNVESCGSRQSLPLSEDENSVRNILKLQTQFLARPNTVQCNNLLVWYASNRCAF
jgi:hypothetical protein